jgi:AcrR family transcriptional regulator
MQYKKEEIFNKILSAAEEEFEKNGYIGASMKNIARISNVPIGNIYRYFSSKSVLFDAVAGPVYENAPKAVVKIYEKAIEENYKIRDFAKDIANSIMEVYSKCSRQLIILVYKSDGTKYNDFKDIIYNLTTQLIKKELFDKDDETDKIISEVVSKGFLNGLFEILKSSDKNNVKELIERLIRFYFNKTEDRI